MFREFWGWKFWNFLSITVFCEVKATKHCNAQKIPKFSGTWSRPGPDSPKILEFLEFFEHYRVS